jgi:T-complex protein 1 subunit eta
LDNVDEYQKVVDAEWNILYDKLDRIAKSGAKVVLSKLPIGDVATQVPYFVNKFCADTGQSSIDSGSLMSYTFSMGGSYKSKIFAEILHLKQ